jgi:hypothetical protein
MPLPYEWFSVLHVACCMQQYEALSFLVNRFSNLTYSFGGCLNPLVVLCSCSGWSYPVLLKIPATGTTRVMSSRVRVTCARRSSWPTVDPAVPRHRGCPGGRLLGHRPSVRWMVTSPWARTRLRSSLSRVVSLGLSARPSRNTWFSRSGRTPPF